jgi:hypothetical protein
VRAAIAASIWRSSSRQIDRPRGFDGARAASISTLHARSLARRYGKRARADILSLPNDHITRGVTMYSNDPQ